MKYIIIDNNYKTEEVSKTTYYKYLKTTPFIESVHTNNGKKVARSVRVNK